MRTKFLSVRPSNREDSVSIAFILSFLFSFLIILYIFDLGFMLVFMEVLAFVVCYVLFGADRISSVRWITYQLRNARQTANHKDTYYLGDEFYKVSTFKDVVTLEDSESEEK